MSARRIYTEWMATHKVHAARANDDEWQSLHILYKSQHIQLFVRAACERHNVHKHTTANTSTQSHIHSIYYYIFSFWFDSFIAVFIFISWVCAAFSPFLLRLALFFFFARQFSFFFCLARDDRLRSFYFWIIARFATVDSNEMTWALHDKFVIVVATSSHMLCVREHYSLARFNIFIFFFSSTLFRCCFFFSVFSFRFDAMRIFSRALIVTGLYRLLGVSIERRLLCSVVIPVQIVFYLLNEFSHRR